MTAVLVHNDPAIEQLTIAGEKLETTPEHLFYTEEEGWLLAKDLALGQHVRKADGNYGLVQQLEIVQHSQVMYNLTVAQAHTFFVGVKQWLVHNNSCPYISPNWGRKRIIDELHDRGYKLEGPSKSGDGLIYTNKETGEEIRIMPEPNVQYRNDPPDKHLNDYYYRYRTGPDQPWGSHTTIPDK